MNILLFLPIVIMKTSLKYAHVNTTCIDMYMIRFCIYLLGMYIIYSDLDVGNAKMAIINAFGFRLCINVIMTYFNYTRCNNLSGRSYNELYTHVFCLVIVSVAYI